MERKRVDSGIERQLIIAMITAKPFLVRLAPMLEPSLFSARHFQTIAKWALDYYRRYGEAPGKDIEPIFNVWAEEETGPQVEAVRDLLSFLSNESDASPQTNTPYLIDMAMQFVAIRRMARLKDELSAAISANDIAIGEAAITDYKEKPTGVTNGIDPLTDRAAWKRAFADKLETLIVFPNHAGRFFENTLTRDALLGIQGPEKRGKTFLCLEFAIRALRNQRSVALFEVGDLSESQIILRLGARLASRPIWPKYCGEIRVPKKLVLKTPDEISMEEDAEGKGVPQVHIAYDAVSCPTTLNYKACRMACRRFMRACGISKENPKFKISIHPNSSINVSGIENILKRWRQEEGFIPDCIIIDYADILAPENTRREFRHQVNETWQALRRLSQEWHCLVIAPTQADAASYNSQIQTMKNFSEDKRKYAHVTGMLGLNQSSKEKEAGVMRLNWLLLRESGFNESKCLNIGQCIPLGRAFTCGVL